MTGLRDRLVTLAESSSGFGDPVDDAAALALAALDTVEFLGDTAPGGPLLTGLVHAAKRGDPEALRRAARRLIDTLIAAELTEPVTVGVGAFIFDAAGRVLLGQRTGAHGAGSWCVPGGHVDDDAVVVAGVRETREETGLRIVPVTLTIPDVVMFSTEKFRLYRDCFIAAPLPAGAEPVIVEPHRCLQWRWCETGRLPSPLFFPLERALARGLDLDGICRQTFALSAPRSR